MVANNLDPMRTAFTVSVDYRVGLTTGISAEERANTLRALANDNCIADGFPAPRPRLPADQQDRRRADPLRPHRGGDRPRAARRAARRSACSPRSSTTTAR